MIFELQKNGFSFFWKSDDSALESLELSTLKMFDLKKRNWDFIFIKKTTFSGLYLQIVLKLKIRKNLIWKIQRENQFWDDKITVFWPFFADFAIFSLCNTLREGWILAQVTNITFLSRLAPILGPNYYWFFRSNLFNEGYFALLVRIRNFFLNFFRTTNSFLVFFVSPQMTYKYNRYLNEYQMWRF